MQIADMPMVRVFFEKSGRAKYTSHLDTMRTLTRAFRRSGLPLWYTEGFNPHLYMTFALPVALGVESACESVDLRLTQAMDPGAVMERINVVLPPGYRAVSAAPPAMDPGHIAWADYLLFLRNEGKSAEELKARLEEFLALPSIETIKKTKKGMKTIDLRPQTKVLSMDCTDDGVELRLRLAAGNMLNISPTLFLRAYADWAGGEPDYTTIRRTAILTGELNAFA